MWRILYILRSAFVLPSGVLLKPVVNCCWVRSRFSWTRWWHHKPFNIFFLRTICLKFSSLAAFIVSCWSSTERMSAQLWEIIKQTSLSDPPWCWWDRQKCKKRSISLCGSFRRPENKFEVPRLFIRLVWIHLGLSLGLFAACLIGVFRQYLISYFREARDKRRAIKLNLHSLSWLYL